MGTGCHWKLWFLEAATAVKTSNPHRVKDMVVSRNGPCMPEFLIVGKVDHCHLCVTDILPPETFKETSAGNTEPLFTRMV